MLKPPPSDSGRIHESWAEVRAHDTVMRYRRWGVGRALLILRSPIDADPLWSELLDALRATHRLIVPEPPAADADVAAWLAGFLEGLGTATVRLLAADRFCVPALELALRQSDQIARIVLVSPGPATPDAGRGAIATAMGRSPVPILVVRHGGKSEDAIALMTEFLAEETAATA